MGKMIDLDLLPKPESRTGTLILIGVFLTVILGMSYMFLLKSKELDVQLSEIEYAKTIPPAIAIEKPKKTTW